MDGAHDIVEMDRMRKMIADHMVRSVQTSPHVTSFVEADVTNLVQWRNANKAFQEKFGEKLTFTRSSQKPLSRRCAISQASMPVWTETES